MRINPIINHNYTSATKVCNARSSQLNFQGKHDATKYLSVAFGTVATLGAAVGTTILSGGLALPFIAAYGAIGVATGAGLGHMIDKQDKNDN